MLTQSFISALVALAPFAAAYTKVDPNNLPHQTESGQYGYNDCGTRDSKNSKCQTSHINDVEDFCLWAPPTKQSIGDSERYEVAWCTAAHHGARLIPQDTFKGVHFVQTPRYLQITGTGDFTKLNIPRGDQGGELDPHGADGNGNPIGSILLSKRRGREEQISEWTQFISDTEFCIRACFDGPNAAQDCQHIYDTEGCYWNMPGNYDSYFETCQGDSTKWPMGLYPDGHGGTSTFYHGQKTTPGPNPAPSSSSCAKVRQPGGASY